MKVGVMQPYFFPYIGYWQLINAVDQFVIFDDVNYIKKGWLNRNKILLNGKEKLINLHIKDASQNRLIKDTEIAESSEDTKKLLATIEQSYHKAPYFNEVYILLEKILNCGYICLSEYLAYLIKEICTFLNITTKLVLSSDIKNDKSLKGETKIIDICTYMKARTYINAIGGRQLYHYENFKQNGLELKFLKTNDISYKQFGDTFIPNLSIIDVMMFNNRQDMMELLNDFSLIIESETVELAISGYDNRKVGGYK